MTGATKLPCKTSHVPVPVGKVPIVLRNFIDAVDAPELCSIKLLSVAYADPDDGLANVTPPSNENNPMFVGNSVTVITGLLAVISLKASR